MKEHVLIVGATSPLATAAAEGFLARGDQVSLVSRTALETSKGSSLAPNARAFAFDLGALDGIPGLFGTMVEAGGPITRMCFFQRYRDGADTPWEGEYAVSVRATSRFIEAFKAAPSGAQDRSVVIISSPADGQVVLEQSASYHAGKAALSQLVRYYAVALGGLGIRVNGVKPAIVLKPRAQGFYDAHPELVTLFKRVTPLGRMGLPKDIAEAVLFLNSPQAAFITGQILSVDGGLSLHESASLARLAASVFKDDLKDPRWESSAP